ncbi:unnamed protein product [Bursaphelenchus xylophilus]|uniref:(pine wood nematode) hypothetical protein n=1 Tax=Bursaphelenchus xylophilus TaxID=6326 RepID=A0A1I7SFS4_BURXY|nr:unnamed protein product [Bursaphelenchus xylophilus]CAG9114358.1 unnamed protein product [Bursaphelenchus xylophilus]
MLFLLLCLSLFILLLFYNFHWKRRNFPPGPAPLPILGNLLQLARQTRWESKFIEWRNEYGPVYTYWLGEKPFIAINTYDTMFKYFVKQADVFSDRHQVPSLMKLVRGGPYGIILSNGEAWSEQRRFALRVLRDFGMGKNQMEERIMVELQWLFEKVNPELGAEEMDFFKYSDIAVGSVINAVVSGYRFTDGREEEFLKMKDLTTRMVNSFMNPLTQLVFRNLFLLKVPLIRNKAVDALGVLKQLFSYIEQQVQRHINENDYNQIEEPNDFIDAYLMECRRREGESGETGNFHLDNLKNICLDLWTAGQETTSATTTWIIALMIHFPEIQEKMQKELDTVIGSKRIINSTDRPGLVYIQAVILESLRYSNLLAQNIPRVVNEDVDIEGYHVKKGTIVIPQISVLMRDPKAFPNPDSMNPERFINSDGTLKHIDEFLPFSVGRRACPGEGMARMELFLLIANLFNQYKFSSGKKAPELVKVSAASTMIKPYKCKVEAR